MPFNRIARIYRRRIVGNPWLYHAKWWAKDVAEAGKMRAKIEIASIKDVVVALARTIPFTARIILDQARNKF